MVCDIHMRVEYWDKNLGVWRATPVGCSSLMPRNYSVFGALADVRTPTGIEPAEPKGFPTDVSWQAHNYYYCCIVDDGDPRPGYEDSRYVHRRTADKWLFMEYSHLDPEDPQYVSDPDWHTPSWMTTSEYESAIKQAVEHDSGVQPSYEILLDVMKRYEECQQECRVVFWFDN